MNESFYVELKNLNYKHSIFDDLDKYSIDSIINNANLDELDMSILRLIKHNSSVTVRELEMSLNVSRTTVSRRINAMVNKGIIRKQGTSQNMKYILLVNVD